MLSSVDVSSVRSFCVLANMPDFHADSEPALRYDDHPLSDIEKAGDNVFALV